MRPMNGHSIVKDMVNYYNWHAKNGGFEMLPKSTGATVWRHAFATSEYQKYLSRVDYCWCGNMEEAAESIGFKMNTSKDEILSTYTTRQNAGSDAHGVDMTRQSDSFISELPDGSEREGMSQLPTRQVTPFSGKKRTREFLLEDEDDDDDDDESEGEDHTSRRRDYIDSDGDDTRKRRAH